MINQNIKIILLLFIASLAFWSNAIGQHTLLRKIRNKESFLNIKLTVDSLTLKDTLRIFFYTSSYPKEEKIIRSEQYATQTKDGAFYFHIKTNSDYGYFSVYKEVTKKELNDLYKSGSEQNIPLIPLVPLCYWERKDNIAIKAIRLSDTAKYADLMTGAGSLKFNYNYVFTGTGSAKYRVALNIKRIPYKRTIEHFLGSDGIHVWDYAKGGKGAMISALEKYKYKLTKSAYYVLKANILFDNPFGLFNTILGTYYYEFDRLRVTPLERPKPDFSYFDNIVFKSKIPPKFLARSSVASDYVINYYAMRYDIERGIRKGNVGRITHPDAIYDIIKNKFSAPFRDKLIISFFINHTNPPDLNKAYDDAFRLIKTAEYITKLQDLNNSRRVGFPAYNFILEDLNGVSHSLSDLKGKLVFLDFWFTGCGGCSAFYQKNLKAVEQHYKKNDSVIFVSVSSDVNKLQWISAVKSDRYCNPESLNLYTNGKGPFHPLIEAYLSTGYPTTMLIDKDSRILKYNTNELYHKDSLIKEIDNALSSH